MAQDSIALERGADNRTTSNLLALLRAGVSSATLNMHAGNRARASLWPTTATEGKGP
jgi:hypothetical protein